MPENPATLPPPNLIEVGDILLAEDQEEPVRERTRFCLVIQCASPEQVRQAMLAGTVTFTRFAHY